MMPPNNFLNRRVTDWINIFPMYPTLKIHHHISIIVIVKFIEICSQWRGGRSDWSAQLRWWLTGKQKKRHCVSRYFTLYLTPTNHFCRVVVEVKWQNSRWSLDFIFTSLRTNYRTTQFMFTLYWIAFRADTKSYPVSMITYPKSDSPL